MKIANTQILTRTVSEGTNVIAFSDTELDDIYKQYCSSNSVTATFILTTANTYTSTNEGTITMTGNQKTIYKKISDLWHRGKIYVNVNGTWHKGVVWKKINGVWRRCI